MADGFIVRKGGGKQALAPTITEVSTTQTSITFTITNNDASTAVILYEVGDATPDENSIELATGVTSDSIEITGLDDGTEYTVSATASVTGKVLSNVTSLAIETDALIYTAATGGTTEEYDSGGKRYKSHTFTSNGTFEVTQVGDAIDDRNKVDYLIIAGGGGGGRRHAGGGGAGGYLTTITPTPSDVSPDAKVTVTATTYGVFIGSGGSGGTGPSVGGANGNTSYVEFSTTITSNGGGGGLSGSSSGSGTVGSGGGASTGTGISGTVGQGRDGGNGITTPNFNGGGGGGAGELGENAISAAAGSGGDGLANLLRTGSNETRGGGGGGSPFGSGVADGSGGAGGGGAGNRTGAPTPGTANTGGGGGANGSDNANGASGGSGIVIIRYEIAPSV